MGHTHDGGTNHCAREWINAHQAAQDAHRQTRANAGQLVSKVDLQLHQLDGFLIGQGALASFLDQLLVLRLFLLGTGHGLSSLVFSYVQELKRLASWSALQIGPALA
jgi:hypothetical protein